MGAISLHIPSKVFVVHYRSLTLSHNNELSSAKEMEFACRRRQVTARGVLTDKPAGAYISSTNTGLSLQVRKHVRGSPSLRRASAQLTLDAAAPVQDQVRQVIHFQDFAPVIREQEQHHRATHVEWRMRDGRAGLGRGSV